MTRAPDPPTPGETWPAAGSPEALARILVVDDEPSVVDVFREFLAAQGYELTVASSGEEAVKLLPALKPDIILTDINLPGLSGLEVMRFARGLDAEVAVIVVTGYASASSAIDALRQGAYDYVTKPFDLDDVHQIVERAIANRRLKSINRQLVEELRQKNEILHDHEQELRQKVKLATWQMTTLFEVGKEISANLELAPRLALITTKAAELSGGRAAVLYLRHEETEECRIAAVHGLELPSHADGAPHYFNAERAFGLPPFEQHPVRRTAAAGAALELPAVGPLTFSSMLAVPMVAEGQSIGMLVAVDKEGGFSAGDESFLALYASQAAIAVRNSQLFEHTKTLDRLKSEFVAVVSHEIRTPLTSVKGAVELLADPRYFPNNEQQTKLLSIAHANAERLLVLINDILDFSKLENAALPMSLERSAIAPVVEQATHNLRTLIEDREIRMEVKLASGLPDLYIDASRVAQVLTNLLSNAIKFSPSGGRVIIEVQAGQGEVRVSVTDDGEGIAADDLPKLFRKFTQVDSSATRKAGGTGLGLVICKGIVEQHGGKIWTAPPRRPPRPTRTRRSIAPPERAVGSALRGLTPGP